MSVKVLLFKWILALVTQSHKGLFLFHDFVEQLFVFVLRGIGLFWSLFVLGVEEMESEKEVGSSSKGGNKYLEGVGLVLKMDWY